MRSSIAAFLVATLTLSGCVSMNGTSVAATPWGAAGIHAFRENPDAPPSVRSVDAEVSKLLRQESADDAVTVANR